MLTDARLMTALAAPTCRAVPWLPLLGGAVVGLGIAAVPAAFSVVLQPADVATLLRVAAVAGALGVAFVLDDPAAQVVAVTPVRRLVRYGFRVLAVLPFAALWWAGLIALTSRVNAAGLPLAGLTLEAATLLAAALALAAVGMRVGSEDAGSVLAVPALVAVVSAVALLPGPAAFFVSPQDPRWARVHVGWAVLLLVAVFAGTFAAHEPRPGRRGRR